MPGLETRKGNSQSGLPGGDKSFKEGDFSVTVRRKQQQQRGIGHTTCNRERPWGGYCLERDPRTPVEIERLRIVGPNRGSSSWTEGSSIGVKSEGDLTDKEVDS